MSGREIRMSDLRAAALPESSYPALRELVAMFVSHQVGWADGESVPTSGADPESVVIRSADTVRPGRPGLIAVIAEVGGRVVHAVIGLRAPGDEVQPLADSDVAPLGIFEDDDGLAVAFDAMSDAGLALLLLEAVVGDQDGLDRVRRVASTAETVSLTFDDRLMFTVFRQLPLTESPHPGLELFLGLDDSGFNHLLAPIARWRRGSYDLGLVQEYEAGSTGGWGLALASLRDLYAAGGPPEQAGVDFAGEARRLGTMTARMHLAFDRAFGRRVGDIARWVEEVKDAVRPVDPGLLEDEAVAALFADLSSVHQRCVAIRTHGDFHLGRVGRTDVGWFVLDFSTGGVPAHGAGAVATDGPVFRSPLADVADMLWSFHHIAEVTAAEWDPSGRLGTRELAQAWEVRNRRSLLAGYLSNPGIGGLVPPVRDVVRKLAAAFELERSASALALRA